MHVLMCGVCVCVSPSACECACVCVCVGRGIVLVLVLRSVYTGPGNMYDFQTQLLAHEVEFELSRVKLS